MTISKTIKLLSIALLFASSLTGVYAKSKSDFKPYTRYMGTSSLAMPTGNIKTAYSYMSDDGDTNMFISQALVNNTLEVSYLKHINGEYKNKSVINCKIKLLDEGTFIPSLVWGVSDATKQIIDKRMYFFAASKSIDTFGLSLSGGYYKDPASNHRKSFYSAEKVIFPLFSVAAEYENDAFTYGLKVNPLPGLELTLGQRDGNQNIYNVSYYATY